MLGCEIHRRLNYGGPSSCGSLLLTATLCWAEHLDGHTTVFYLTQHLNKILTKCMKRIFTESWVQRALTRHWSRKRIRSWETHTQILLHHELHDPNLYLNEAVSHLNRGVNAWFIDFIENIQVFTWKFFVISKKVRTVCTCGEYI